MPTFSWFGDWNVIHKLRSIIQFVAAPDPGAKSIVLLCISKKKFKDLLETYPHEKKHFSLLSLIRRKEILSNMDAENK